MRRRTAAPASAGWFLLTAAVGVLWLPWMITRGRVAYRSTGWWPVQAVGVLVIVMGMLVAAQTFAGFVRAEGTPVPGAPTRRLVVSGWNRYVRNPIYLGVLAVLIGEATFLGQPRLLGYAVIVWLGAAVFVRLYEEPTLHRRFGTQYDDYRRAVPAWRPRLHPWTPSKADKV